MIKNEEAKRDYTRVCTCVHKFDSHAGKNATDVPVEFSILVVARMLTDLLMLNPYQIYVLFPMGCTRNPYSFHSPGWDRPVIGPRTLTIHIPPQALALYQLHSLSTSLQPVRTGCPLCLCIMTFLYHFTNIYSKLNRRNVKCPSQTVFLEFQPQKRESVCFNDPCHSPC